MPAHEASSAASNRVAPGTTASPLLWMLDLGRARYQAALDVQLSRHEAVRQGEAPPTLILVEHEPVITLTRRRGVADHLVASESRLAELGIEVQPIAAEISRITGRGSLWPIRFCLWPRGG